MTAVVLAFGPEAEPGDRVAVALRWVMARIWGGRPECSVVA